MNITKAVFATVLTDLDGEPLIEASQKEATLKSITLGALTTSLPMETDGKLKLRCAQLAIRINSMSDSINLRSDQVTLIRDRIGKLYGPMVVLRALSLLGEVDEKAEDADAKLETNLEIEDSPTE